MLHLWLCTDRKENTARVLETICRQAEAGRGGQLLLVPEQFSHMTERLLCKRGGAAVSRFAEVLGFSRLATRVFSQVGGCAEGETDMAGRLLSMALAVEQVRSRLKIYGVSVAKPEFLLQLLATFDEFRSFCVTPERLRQVSRELTGVLAEKSEEFALLMESSDTVCARMGQNPETRLGRLLTALELSDFARGKTFYFDGFTDFNGVEMEIIAQLLDKGAEVTVALQCPDLARATQQFAAAEETARRLLRQAQRQGVEALVEKFAPEGPTTALDVLRECLFSGAPTVAQTPQEELVFMAGADRVEECRAAAGEILRLVATGVRWREISIACADMNSYRPTLESLFRRAEIPAYFAGNTDILRQPVAQMLLTALEAATGNMETETVLTYIKSGFLPLTAECCDRLENYVLLWGISGAQWERAWTMSPYGLDKRDPEAATALLAELNGDRAVVIPPLLHLRRGLRSAKNTGEMVLRFYDFMEELSLRDCLNDWARHQFEKGDLQSAQEYVQVYGSICTLMEQMYGVLGESVRTPEEFFRIFRTTLSQCAVGTIPASLDCVTVGDLLSQRRCDTDYVFILGAQEGVFPVAQTRPSLLTERERRDLQGLGIGLAPTAAGALEREFAAIDSVLSAPGKRLYLSAVTGQEAYLFRRAREIFPQATCLQGEAELLCRAEREYLACLVARREEPEEEERRATVRRLAQAADYTCGDLSPAAVRELYGNTLRLSSTKVDALAQCRFAYFLKYGLRAREREPVQMDANLYGSFVHEVLEKTGRRVMAEGGFHTVPLQRVLDMAEEEMERYTARELAPLWQTARAEYLFRRNFAEVRAVVEDMYEELSAAEFAPAWFELEFSSGGLLPAVRIVGEKMTAYLEGKVDRVDLWRGNGRVYVRIVDYKTGRQDMEYTRLYHGLGLQMLLYLFSFVRLGADLCGQRPEAAGVLYFPARMEKISLPDKSDLGKQEALRRKSRRRSGMVLDCVPVLQAMEQEEPPRYLPYGYNRAGEREGDLFTPEALQQLEYHIFSTVAALGDELCDGKLEPNPFFLDAAANACAWCSYATVCRQKGKERWLEKIKNAREFWEKLEVEHHG